MSSRRKDRQDWCRSLPFGLPRDFDFGVIRTVADVTTLMCTLPNSDRGIAARTLYEHHGDRDRKLAYAALIQAWEHDDRVVVEAFERPDAFTEALGAVGPPIKRQRPLRVWRGIVVRDAHPAHAAIGLSWTRSRDIACWFATRHYATGLRPFVFEADLRPSAIVALHDGRREQEVIVDLAELAMTPIVVDGTTIDIGELATDNLPPAAALARHRHSSSASRFTAGDFGFLTLIQC